MYYDTTVVGGGIAGLTPAAFLCKSGQKAILCEKQDRLGNQRGYFDYNGLAYDAGIRVMKDPGVLIFILNSFDEYVEFLDSNISIGLRDVIIDITLKDSIKNYF